jgi:hypothetical protein
MKQQEVNINRLFILSVNKLQHPEQFCQLVWLYKKNGKGTAIPLFFCYARQTGKATLNAAQLINPG